MKTTSKFLLACLAALCTATAHAGVGLTELSGLQGDGPVTVYTRPVCKSSLSGGRPSRWHWLWMHRRSAATAGWW